MENMLDRATFLLASLASSLSVTARAAPTHAPTVSALLSPEIVLVPNGPIDMLSPVTVRVGIRNRSIKAIDVAFANAETFLLEIREKDRVLWSSAFEHKPIEIGRTISIAPGVFQLANYVLEGTTNDRRALAAGTYTVHVEILGKTFAPIIDKTLVYAPPLPIDRALKAKNGTMATIVGSPTVIKGITTLSDGSGAIRLSRALGIGAVGVYAVHGYVDINEVGTQFAVARFMPLRDPDEKPDPTPSPSPRP